MNFAAIIRKIPNGHNLYRFVNKKPSEISIGNIIPNNGHIGRFNRFENIYYCCNSLSALRIENINDNHNNKIQGSLIVSEILEPIYVLQIQSYVLWGTQDYDITNGAYKKYIINNPCADYIDGICYPSIKGFPNGINGFCISDEDTLFCSDYDLNIGLRQSGFMKIREKSVVDIRLINYWN